MEMPFAYPDDFQSDRLEHRWGDLFNPPGLTNGWGSLQADMDLMAVRHLNFPPYAMGETQTAVLFVNGINPAMAGGRIAFRWQPDRILREGEADGLHVETATALGVGERSAVIRVRVTNPSAGRREAEIRIRHGGGIVCDRRPWRTPYSPQEGPRISVTPWEGTPPAEQEPCNAVEADPARGALRFRSVTSPAVLVSGVAPPVAPGGPWSVHRIALDAGACWTGYAVLAVEADLPRALALYDRLAADPEASLARAEAFWRSQLEAAFTPGNSRFSGHLPVLHTRNDAARRIYLNTAACMAYFRRDPPESVQGPVYATLLPRYWVTTSFLNDIAVSSGILAALDPLVLRAMAEHWLAMGLDRHFGSEYLTGGPVGNWYSVNDHGICRIAEAYLRVTGDLGWLSKAVAGRSVLEHLKAAALNVRALNRHGHGVGDFGPRNSLLECVGSYLHEVASLNAAAVWNLRFVARLCERAGDGAAAAACRGEAARLLPETLRLYAPGRGFFRCRMPDGAMRDTRHLWDFCFVLNTIPDDLPEAMRREMTAFFTRELMTETWARALSPLDEDAGFSLRPDHQWNGSWPGWIALSIRGLCRIGEGALAAAWIKGIARSANQGPYGQAHFAEGAAETDGGGARKAPTEWPFICDWTCSTVGGFYDAVVEGVMGLRADPLGDHRAGPFMPGTDPGARLENLQLQGRPHRLDASGLHPC